MSPIVTQTLGGIIKRPDLASIASLSTMQAASVDQMSSDMTSQLSGLSKNQLAKISQVIVSVQQGDDIPLLIPDPPVSTGYERGQLTSSQVMKDIDGNIVSTTNTEWTYYPTGEVNTITITQLDSSGTVISTQVIQHYTDGRQPTNTVMPTESETLASPAMPAQKLG
jgi:hypothetical protein